MQIVLSIWLLILIISSELDLVNSLICYCKIIQRGPLKKEGSWMLASNLGDTYSCTSMHLFPKSTFSSQCQIFHERREDQHFWPFLNEKSLFFLWFSSFGIGFWGWVTITSFCWPWIVSCFIWLTHTLFALSRSLWIESLVLIHRVRKLCVYGKSALYKNVYALWGDVF